MHTTYSKWIWVLPVLIILVGIGGIPFAYAIGMSLTHWPRFPGESITFVGFQNYKNALLDPTFLNSLRVTFTYLVIAIPVEFLLGLCFALALTNIKFKARKFICSFLLTPSMLAPVVVGVIWKLVLSSYSGPVDFILEKLGIKSIDWLGNPKYSLPSIIIADVWQWTPFTTMILLSGMVALPISPFEAAIVDGAGSWDKFRYITLPLLKPVILITIILRSIDGIKMFGLVQVMTQGGPGNSTNVITYYIYNQGFMYWSLSYASALTIIVLPIVIVITTSYIKIAQLKLIK